MTDQWTISDRLGGPIFPGMVSITSKLVNNVNNLRPIIPKNGVNFNNHHNQVTIKPGSPLSTSQTACLINNINNSNQQQQSLLCTNKQTSACLNNSNSSSTSSSSSLNKFISANQRKRYSCEQCSYSTDRRDLYRRHENIHRDEKPFRCYVCNKMFNRADHVKKHFLRIHKGLEYNVKLIKRANGVDYPTPNATNIDNNTNNNINIAHADHQAIGDVNNGPTGLSPINCLNNLPTFNLALWNDESNRLLFNNYSSQAVYPQSKQINQHQPHQLLQQQQHLREPLSIANSQANRDLISLISDTGLTLCVKLNGTNNINSLANTINSQSNNNFRDELLTREIDSSYSPLPSPKTTVNCRQPSSPTQSTNSSLISTPPSSPPSAAFNTDSAKQSEGGRNSKTSIIIIDDNQISPKRVCLNKRPGQIITSKCSSSVPIAVRKSTSLLSPVPKPLSASPSPDKSPYSKQTKKLKEPDQLASSSSSLLANKESLPFASLIFNTEPTDARKINWFNRLNPVRVNSISTNSSPNQQYQPQHEQRQKNVQHVEIPKTLRNSESYSSESLSDYENSQESCNYLDDETLCIDDEPGDDLMSSDESADFPCEFCGCAFVDYPSLHTHRFLLHHYISHQDNYYPYTCVVCGKRRATQRLMIQHMKDHNSPIIEAWLQSKADSQSNPKESNSRRKKRKQSQPKRAFKPFLKVNYTKQMKTT